MTGCFNCTVQHLICAYTLHPIISLHEMIVQFRIVRFAILILPLSSKLESRQSSRHKVGRASVRRAAEDMIRLHILL